MNTKEQKRLRRELPLLDSGSLIIDLFTEVFFDKTGAWLVSPEGVYRSFRGSKGWCQWEKRELTASSFKDWFLQKDR